MGSRPVDPSQFVQEGGQGWLQTCPAQGHGEGCAIKDRGGQDRASLATVAELNEVTNTTHKSNMKMVRLPNTSRMTFHNVIGCHRMTFDEGNSSLSLQNWIKK